MLAYQRACAVNRDSTLNIEFTGQALSYQSSYGCRALVECSIVVYNHVCFQMSWRLISVLHLDPRIQAGMFNQSDGDLRIRKPQTISDLCLPHISW